jgi:hypothetical protein
MYVDGALAGDDLTYDRAMQALTGAVLVAAALLVLAGLPKIARPTATTTALRTVGLTAVTRTHVRVLAVVEVSVGAYALVRGGVVADLAVAALYAGFSVFLVRALRSSAAGVSCGCTGSADTPPTYAHLVLTGTLAVVTAVAALGGGATGFDDLVAVDGIAEPVLVAGLAMIGTWFGWVVLHDLAELRLLPREAAER